MSPIRVIVVEGALEVPIVVKILDDLGLSAGAPAPIDKRGRQSFWADIERYNRAARQGPVIALADLENEPCAAALFARHLPRGRHPRLLLRLAVRILESWLLAHRDAAAEFLQVSVAKIPTAPDQEVHPKRTLVNLAQGSRSRRIRDDIAPAPGTSAIVGPNYTARMGEFIRCHWRPRAARTRSPSLHRALRALESLADSQRLP